MLDRCAAVAAAAAAAALAFSPRFPPARSLSKVPKAGASAPRRRPSSGGLATLLPAVGPTTCGGGRTEDEDAPTAATATAGDGRGGVQPAVSIDLPSLFPALSPSLSALNFLTPTPIQLSSAPRALNDENLLLIAPTGSGKTLAYLLPSLTRALDSDGTVLVVAPTRELAVQLRRDALGLLSTLSDDAESSVVLAVRGVDVPTPQQLGRATVLIGTPSELGMVLTNVAGGYDFVAGDALRSVVLDEVDVLLPPPSKALRTSLDSSDRKGTKKKKQGNTPQDERRRQEQRRKLMAAKRRGADLNDAKQIVTPTEKILGIVASCCMSGMSMGGANDNHPPPQVLAGSATASRRTLDRLNRALRAASEGASLPFDLTWGGDVKPCRPEVGAAGAEAGAAAAAEDDNAVESEGGGIASAAEAGADDRRHEQRPQHTIRAVTVPAQVSHRYVTVPKSQSTSASAVLTAVAHAASVLRPRTALLFLCGAFGKPNANQAVKAPKPAELKGATSKARRNAAMKRRTYAARAAFRQQGKGGGTNDGGGGTAVGLSARRTCAVLADLGIDAMPLHVALGLELNAKKKEEDGGGGGAERDDADADAADADDGADVDADAPNPDDGARFLVTFEGSARGLHFDNVDAVFVVGRPSSAASYLHLAGRVGRCSAPASSDGTGVAVRPGTVVSVCTQRGAAELDKWTRQVGGTGLEELVLPEREG